MIAIDTNILIYAHRPSEPLHERAVSAVESLADSGQAFAIPWPVVHEFIGVVTHARRYQPPSSNDEAIGAIERFAELPQCHFISEGHGHLGLLAGLVKDGAVTGPRVHDARIAAICLAHGVRELWTADRDFSRFPRLRTRNPLVG